MKTQELRIGNYIMSKNDEEQKEPYELMKVLSIMPESVMYCDIEMKYYQEELEQNGYCMIDIIEPITLTEEWLVRFGFKVDSDLKDCLVNSGLWFNNKNMECHYRGAKLLKIKYVHQLQNLYFALIGEELYP